MTTVAVAANNSDVPDSVARMSKFQVGLLSKSMVAKFETRTNVQPA